MKTPRMLITAGALSAFSFGLAAPTFGQGQMRQSESQSPQMQQQSGAEGSGSQQASQQAVRATELTGSRVVNSDGDRLGTLDDLAIKLEEGLFAYAIISSGGFLGIGGELHPVPPGALQTREVEMGLEIVLDMTTDRWEDAPTIDRDQVQMLAQETRGQEIYQFYGQDWQAHQQRTMEFAAPPQQRDQQQQQSQQQQQPSAQVEQIEQQLNEALTNAGVDEQQAQQQAQRLAQQFVDEQPNQQEIQNQVQQALAQAGVDQQEARQQAQDLAGQLERQVEFAAPPQSRQQTQGTQQQQQQQQGAAPQTRDSSQMESTEENDGGGFVFQDKETLRPASEMNLASDLMSATVVNQQQEEIGHISDFLVLPQDGRIAFALITTESNFWEMTDDEYAVPTKAFEIHQNQLTLNLTQQDLEVAELLTPSQLQGQLERLGGMPADQARQSPQVFRYEERESAPGVFGGTPARESEDANEVPEAEEGQQPQRQQQPETQRPESNPQNPLY